MMILPDKKDAIHKAWLYRVIEAIADNAYLSKTLYFKGGTCASMLDWLDRFSVDLDFDYAGETDGQSIKMTRETLEKLFSGLGLTIKDASKNGLQYFLKYDAKEGERNTLKVDAQFPLFSSSTYSPQRLGEIDRVLTCQSKETMFAHKLVAVVDRFEKTGGIAGRDIYDIHHFFLAGFSYNQAVIEERRKTSSKKYIDQLARFIETHVTDTVIIEDLGPLLTQDKLKLMRKVLKRETINLLKTRYDSLV